MMPELMFHVGTMHPVMHLYNHHQVLSPDLIYHEETLGAANIAGRLLMPNPA